jgi:hypothetical protein
MFCNINNNKQGEIESVNLPNNELSKVYPIMAKLSGRVKGYMNYQKVHKPLADKNDSTEKTVTMTTPYQYAVDGITFQVENSELINFAEDTTLNSDNLIISTKEAIDSVNNLDISDETKRVNQLRLLRDNLPMSQLLKTLSSFFDDKKIDNETKDLLSILSQLKTAFDRIGQDMPVNLYQSVQGRLIKDNQSNLLTIKGRVLSRPQRIVNGKKEIVYNSLEVAGMELYMNPFSSDAAISKEALKTLVHELTHVLTLQALESDNVFKQDIEKLYVQALSKYNRLKESNSIPYMYGMTNIKEFISESLSNAQFQKFLNNITDINANDKNNTSLLNRLSEAILNAIDRFLLKLNISINKDSVLDSVFKKTLLKVHSQNKISESNEAMTKRMKQMVESGEFSETDLALQSGKNKTDNLQSNSVVEDELNQIRENEKKKADKRKDSFSS